MAFLELVIVAALFAADADDLQSVSEYNPALGNFFDCAAISLPSNPTDDQKEATIQKCLDTKWCLWSTAGAGTCFNDLCLKSLGNTQADFDDCAVTRNAATTTGCTVRYLTDGYNCTSATHEEVKTDRFCRATDNSAYKRAVIDECFYKDLASIGQNWDGPRLCTGAICSNKTSNQGGYCAITGNDCSQFDSKDSNEYCNCLGSANCDLYPHCYKDSSSTCSYDTCTNSSYVNPNAQNEGAVCYFVGGTAATNCKVRPEQAYVSGNTYTTRWVCVNKQKSHANECYFAVKSTVNHVVIPTDPSSTYCDTVTYDESICTGAPILLNDGGAGVTPSSSDHYAFSTEANCTLVDIAAQYVGPTAGKYCTDGDRTVPSPDAGSLIHIPFSVALILLAAFLL